MSHQQTVELIHRLESISDEVDLYINGESVKNLIYIFVTSLCLSLGSTVYSQIPVPPSPRPVPSVTVTVVDGQADITREMDLCTELPRAVANGATLVRINAGTYTVKAPIILNAKRLHIYGVGNPLIVHDIRYIRSEPNVDRKWGLPVFYPVVEDFKISGVTIDWNRDTYPPYGMLFDPVVPTWVERSYEGPRDRWHSHFEISACRFIDSLNATHKGVKGDDWIITPKGIGGFNFKFNGNRCECIDTELTGGTASWQNVEFVGNHIWGGTTGGGSISMLSRGGRVPRPARSVRITDNVLYNHVTYFISLGYDSGDPSVMDFDNVLIANNRSFLVEQPRRFIQFTTIKFRHFDGTLVYRDNVIDCSKVSEQWHRENPLDPSGAYVRGRTIAAKNSTAVGVLSGTIIYDRPRIIQPEWGSVRMSEAIIEQQFKSVIKYP